MISSISIFLIWATALAFGRAGAIIFPRAAIKDDELADHFSVKGRNLTKIMTDISNISTQIFGTSIVPSFLKFNMFLYLFFLLALAWQVHWISGYNSVSRFFIHGFTINVDENERSYLLQGWPGVFDSLLDRDRFYLGDVYIDTIRKARDRRRLKTSTLEHRTIEQREDDRVHGPLESSKDPHLS
jgi:hypothetical protein